MSWWDSLAGLSVGDALGAQYFVPGNAAADLSRGILPAAPWPWTDDTEMACVLAAELVGADGAIDQDRLAAAFAERCDAYRGYGPGAVRILHQIRDGVAWRDAAAAAFGGQGSCGNGAAMRVAPLGARHAGDPRAAGRAAYASAEITHAALDGIAGAVAVAVAAAVAAGARGAARPEPGALLDAALAVLPPCATERAVRRAREASDDSIARAAYELGNGAQSTAQDTVGFALWAADRFLTDYPRAVVACVSAGGDVDTTAAIVGGIVAAYTGVGDRPDVTGVPAAWLAAREPLPDWLPAQ